MENLKAFSMKTDERKKIYTERDILRLRLQCSRAERLLHVVIFLSCLMVVGLTCMFKLYSEQKKTYESAVSEYTQMKEQYRILGDQYEIVNSNMKEATVVIKSLSDELEATKASLARAEEYISSNISAPENKKYTPNTDLGVTTVMSSERMNRIIDYWNSKNGGDSPFKGQGEAFVTAGNITGLDPLFIFAISSHESNFGKSRIARDKGNYMGIGAFDASPYTSALNLDIDDVGANIIANAVWVSENYYQKGQNTLNSMIYGGKCYSSSKDDWIDGINAIMVKSTSVK